MVDNGKPSFLAVYMILSARKLMPSVLLRFGMETIRSWMLRTDWEYPQPWNQPVVYATSIKNHQKPPQIPSFWFETQAYLSKLLDICQLGIVSLSFTWKVHDAWLANRIHHSSSFINYTPIFLMITVIPVNMLNLTWMMIESPVQITIHNPQKR